MPSRPGKSRIETLSILVVGMVAGRTVNLPHFASVGAACRTHRPVCGRGGSFSTSASDQTGRRHIARLICGNGDRTPVPDRATWTIGGRDVNHLVLAVVTRRFVGPLFRTLPDVPGNRATGSLTLPVRGHLADFPASKVRVLLAARSSETRG